MFCKTDVLKISAKALKKVCTFSVNNRKKLFQRADLKVIFLKKKSKFLKSTGTAFNRLQASKLKQSSFQCVLQPFT